MQTWEPHQGIARVDNLLMESHACEWIGNGVLQSKAPFSPGLGVKSSRAEKPEDQGIGALFTADLGRDPWWLCPAI